MRDGLETVDGIPVRWIAPDAPQGVALWLTHLGGSTEQTVPMLTRLAERGMLAVSFDPAGHGQRSSGGDRWALVGEVLEAFRRRMWPVAGRTVLESLRAFDGADDQFRVAGEGTSVSGADANHEGGSARQ